MGQVDFENGALRFGRLRSSHLHLQMPDKTLRVPDCSVALNPLFSPVNSACRYRDLVLPGDTGPVYNYDHLPQRLRVNCVAGPQGFNYTTTGLTTSNKWETPGIMSLFTPFIGGPFTLYKSADKVLWQTQDGPYTATSRLVTRKLLDGVGGDPDSPLWSVQGESLVDMTGVGIGDSYDQCGLRVKVGFLIHPTTYPAPDFGDGIVVDMKPFGGDTLFSQDVQDWLDAELGTSGGGYKSPEYWTPGSTANGNSGLEAVGSYDLWEGGGFPIPYTNPRFNFPDGINDDSVSYSLLWPQQTGPAIATQFSAWYELDVPPGLPWVFETFGGWDADTTNGNYGYTPSEPDLFTPHPCQDIEYRVAWVPQPTVADFEAHPGGFPGSDWWKGVCFQSLDAIKFPNYHRAYVDGGVSWRDRTYSDDWDDPFDVVGIAITAEAI